MSRRRIFISGAFVKDMCSMANEQFDKASKMIAMRGDVPVNPMRICSPSWNWQKCTRRRLKELLDCDGIYMLEGWKTSGAAKTEHFVALKLKMTIELEK